MREGAVPSLKAKMLSTNTFAVRRTSPYTSGHMTECCWSVTFQLGRVILDLLAVLCSQSTHPPSPSTPYSHGDSSAVRST